MVTLYLICAVFGATIMLLQFLLQLVGIGDFDHGDTAIDLEMDTGVDADGHEQVRLLKVSSDKDCRASARGITFSDYRETAGIMVPWKKQLVSGLDEKVLWTAVTQSFEPMFVADQPRTKNSQLPFDFVSSRRRTLYQKPPPVTAQTAAITNRAWLGGATSTQNAVCVPAIATRIVA